MTASLLNGKHVASKLKNMIKNDVSLFIKHNNRAPGLAVILVGDDPASSIYVNNKRKACLELGFKSFYYSLPLQTFEDELLLLIETLNEEKVVDGILVQLPLPKHLDTAKIIEQIAPSKDVDGFHPYNIGRLAQGTPFLRPCTPMGVMNLLQYYKISLSGKHAVVIGASNIVGRPMALELLKEKATVTICHRLTCDLDQHIRRADIIVSAAGSMDVINPEWLNKSQIIVDVGIHRLLNGSICGDVDFNKVQDKVAWVTPVPGGVGPMTICMLLRNTLLAAEHSYQIEPLNSWSQTVTSSFQEKILD